MILLNFGSFTEFIRLQSTTFVLFIMNRGHNEAKNQNQTLYCHICESVRKLFKLFHASIDSRETKSLLRGQFYGERKQAKDQYLGHMASSLYKFQKVCLLDWQETIILLWFNNVLLFLFIGYSTSCLLCKILVSGTPENKVNLSK